MTLTSLTSRKTAQAADDELDAGVDEGAVLDGHQFVGLGRPRRASAPIQVREVEAGQQQADRRHDDLVDQALGDVVEGRADDHADRQVDDVAAGDELAEFRKVRHADAGLLLFARPYSSVAFSRSRSSLPLLKKGTCLAWTSTGSPVRSAAGASVARTDRQGAEAPQFHPAALLQGLDHALQHHADHAFDVALGQMKFSSASLAINSDLIMGPFGPRGGGNVDEKARRFKASGP